MSSNKSQSVPQGQFLTMAANLIYKAFLESSRTQSKNLYKVLLEGKAVPLTKVQMEDKSVVRFDIALDHSEFKGNINFGAFRSSVSMLLSSLGETLKKDEEVPVFSAHHDPNVMIFGVTAVTQEAKDAPNVMVLGANMSADDPLVMLKLMYLDHEQFSLEPEASA